MIIPPSPEAGDINRMLVTKRRGGIRQNSIRISVRVHV
jgi:hypothetical protein